MLNYYEMLKAGRTIEITDPAGQFSPARFWMDGEQLKTWAPTLGTLNRVDLTPAELDSHLYIMLADGMAVTITEADELHRWTITQAGADSYRVEIAELMGGRWVALGPAESYNREALADELGAED